jgi:hypothetical protein
VADGPNFSAGFPVEYVVPAPLRVHWIPEQDLRALQGAGDKESICLAFFSLAVGALLSAILGWVPLENPSAAAKAVYAGVSLALLLSSVVSGLLWRVERKTRVELLQSMLGRAGLTDGATVSTVAAP